MGLRSWCIMLAGLAWSQSANAACSVPTGWDTVVGPSAHFVIFGEIQGTAESPTLFGETACALADRGEHLLVAVELASSDNAGLQRAWAGAPADFEKTVLAEMPQWKDGPDGVTSQAMMAMLARLHTLKADGKPIDIVAFNTGAFEQLPYKDLPGQGPHEAGQAAAIRAADARGHYDRVLVLVGNYHARKKPVAFGGAVYQPMAMVLSDPSSSVSLNLALGAGMAWDCQLKGAPPASGVASADMVDCSAHPIRAMGPWTGAPQLIDTHGQAGPGNPDAAYDATLYVGPATASPPVKMP